MPDVNPINAHIIELGADNSLTLPAEFARILGAGRSILVLQQGDTIILKPILMPNLLARVADDTEPPPTMDELNELVHAVRRQQRKADQDEDCR
jgi:virulence-associated protein VagC